METITIHTTQNIDIDYEIGGLGERIVGRLIDIAIFLPFFFGGLFLIATHSTVIIGAFYVILLIIFVFYDLVCEVFFNGQSFGKRVMKIRVISLDGARPRFSQYLLRWLFRMVDFTITGGVAALISAAVTKNGQRIGDMVADTALIKTVPRTQMDNLVYVNTGDSYQPVFAEANQLTDKDIGLIHEVMENYFKTGNNVLVYNLADRLRGHLSINMPADMNSMQFLQTLVKDYSHISAHADSI